jgi:hypothetical protein
MQMCCSAIIESMANWDEKLNDVYVFRDIKEAMKVFLGRCHDHVC